MLVKYIFPSTFLADDELLNRSLEITSFKLSSVLKDLKFLYSTLLFISLIRHWMAGFSGTFLEENGFYTQIHTVPYTTLWSTWSGPGNFLWPISRFWEQPLSKQYLNVRPYNIFVKFHHPISPKYSLAAVLKNIWIPSCSTPTNVLTKSH